MGKSTGLEGLRFFLAVWVFLAHLLPWYKLSSQSVSGIEDGALSLFSFINHITQPKGSLHPAVIGFLVLSGYVITLGYNQQMMAQSRYKYLGSWLIRRAFRIMPVYLLSLLIGAIVFLQLRATDMKYLSGTDVLSARCLTAKAFSISSVLPYQYPNCAFQGNAPLVTTAAEIGLYLIFIFSMIYVSIGNIKVLAATSPLLWLMGNFIVALNSTSTNILEWWTHASSINYIFPWFVGMTLAFTKKQENKLYTKKLVRNFTAVGAITPPIYFIMHSNLKIDPFVRQSVLIFWSLFFCLIIIYFSKVQTKFNRILIFLGGISYPLYAIHAPLAIYLMSKKLNLGFIIFIIFLSSAVIYFIFEKPLRKLGWLLSARIIK